MQTHRRKKVEIVVERARAPAVLDRIEALGAKVSRLAHAVHVAVVGCSCWLQSLKTIKKPLIEQS
jgi:hypothetical protein